MRSQRKEGSDVQGQINWVRNTERRWKLLQTEGRGGEVASSAVGSFNTINFNMALAVSVFASLWNKAS